MELVELVRLNVHEPVLNMKMRVIESGEIFHYVDFWDYRDSLNVHVTNDADYDLAIVMN